MEAFCGSKFWDYETVWNTDDPDLTVCFEKTVLVWVPCTFLWLFLPLEIHLLGRSKSSEIPWNTYNVTKLLAITILTAVPLTDIVINVFLSSSYFPIDLYSPLIEFFTFVLFFGLTFANVRFGRRSSAVLFIFSLLLLLSGVFQFRTEIRLKWDQNIPPAENFVAHIIYYSLVLVLFIMNCLADSAPRIPARPVDKNACPRNQSSFLSRILFTWFEPLAWKGYRKSLENQDLWTLDYSISSSNIVPKFEKELDKCLEKIRKASHLGIHSKCKYKLNQDKTKNISIVPALCRTFGYTFIMATSLKIFLDVFIFVNPQILSWLIDFIGSDEPMWKGYTYAVLLFIVAVLQSVLFAQYEYIMSAIGLQIRACLISTVYKKTLRISNYARRDFTVGETVNLMTVDAYRFINLLPFSYVLFSSPVQAVLAVYFLWQLLGPSALAGFVVMVFSILMNSLVASKIKSLQFQQMQKKDERVKLMNQILSGIKVLKLYAWEPSFENQVLAIRNEEMKILKKQAFLNGINTFIWCSTSFLVYLSTFAIYVLSSEKNVLTAKVAFVSLSLFNILKLPLLLVPEMVSNLIQTWVSVKRIDKFLNSEDSKFENVTHEERAEVLVIENGSFSWEGSKGSPILRNINVKINPGALVAVVGPVGAGKSSLISAFLGEIHKITGIVNTRGTVAYVPQQAWIRNATLRDNVTFGEAVVRSRYYNEVVEGCALKPDLEILPAGDLTEIGEKGINLSGGQKQRVSLARAVYYDADVYLLDDPLSAVDSRVGKHIFERVIGPDGLLKKKTRVLVTHSVTYLSLVDLIVVVKDGSISESGTFEELLDNKGDFSEFLINYLEENKDSNEEDFEALMNILDEKKLITEKLARHGSLKSESRSVPVINRQQSIRDKKRISFRKSNTIRKNNTVGEKLIEEENIESGTINWSVYAYFVRSAGYFVAFVMVLSNCLLQGLSIFSNMWLSKWSDDPNAVTSEGTQDTGQRNHYLLIFTLLGLSKCVAEFMTCISIRIACRNTAKILHNVMLNRLFRLPASFMDVTPSGRILSRFSKDVDVVDTSLPDQIAALCFCLGDVVTTLIIVSCSTPIFIIAVVPIALLYYLIQRFYVATSRQLKRLESVSRSPIYSHFVETIVGLQSVRAYGLSPKFIQQSEEKVDLNHQSYYLSIVSRRWLAIRSEIICDLIILLAAVFAVQDRDTISPGVAGLSVEYTLLVAITLSISVYLCSEVETNIVSIERIKEYSDTPQEAPWNIPNEEVPSKWPSQGEINFQDFQVRYRDGLELALKGVSFSVNSGEKVGIVGRTGAGKSSLTLSLFRMLESAGGRILIDGVDIAALGLHTLRSRLTIIPQDPVVFAGSLRMNLDPLGVYSDDDIWRALELAHLKPFILSLDGGLGHEIIEGGENFSVGQRQLICLARALLRKTKVLILDEATAAVDLETDDLIQSTIRKEFSHCTVLTIAHRLNTIMDYDRIIVLDQGQVVEYDSPKNLLLTKNSIFYAMAVDARLV